MTDVNYVMACYFGERSSADPRFIADNSFYLQQQLESLERLHHNLKQITIVCSGKRPDRMIVLPDQIGSAKIAYVQRENAGMSYGAFSDVYEIYRKEFSHYIFAEDDYLFTRDNFDDLMLAEQSRKDCGMLCGLSMNVHAKGEPGVLKPHAAVFITMSSSDALEKARTNRYCAETRLPYQNLASMNAGNFSQRVMSFAVVDAGYKISNWLDKWSTAYWDSPHELVRWFGSDLQKPSFIVPIQALHRECTVSDGSSWRHIGSMDEHGVFKEIA